MAICCRDVQSLNAPPSSFSSFGGRTTPLRLPQYAKALVPIEVRPSGKDTEVMSVRYEYQGTSARLFQLSIAPLPVMVSFPVALSKVQVRLPPQVPLYSSAFVPSAVCGSSAISSAATTSIEIKRFFKTIPSFSRKSRFLFKNSLPNSTEKCKMLAQLSEKERSARKTTGNKEKAGHCEGFARPAPIQQKRIDKCGFYFIMELYMDRPRQGSFK